MIRPSSSFLKSRRLIVTQQFKSALMVVVVIIKALLLSVFLPHTPPLNRPSYLKPLSLAHVPPRVLKSELPSRPLK